jgi:transcriptional regulator with XRE-family HTH domain
MRLQEIGHEIRKARVARGLTQAQLASAAGLSRVTLNQFESGVFPDLGVRKLQAVLEQLGLRLSIHAAPSVRTPDFISIASTSASVSFKEPLSEEELIRALLTGKVPPGKRPHFRSLLEESKPSVVRGLLDEVSRWTKAGRVERNLAKIARTVGVADRIDEWLATA